MRKKIIITEAIILYIKENYENTLTEKIAEELHIPKHVIYQIAQENKIKKSKEFLKNSGSFFAQRLKNKLHLTDEQLNYIKDNYAFTINKDIASQLSLSEGIVYRAAQKLGLKKSNEFKKKYGSIYSTNPKSIENRFKPGNKPKNKGKKQSEYMSADAIERSKATRFAVGSIPGNKQEIGDISKRYNKKEGKWYQHIKYKEGLNSWMFLHKYNYEKAHGKMPPGTVLRFIDGNTMNAEVNNLELITKQENALRNSPWTGAGTFTDKMIATSIIGANTELYKDKKLIEEIQDNKELIEVKRLQFELKKKIRNHERK